MPFHRMVRRSFPLAAGCLLALSGCSENDTFGPEHDGSSVEFDVGQQFFVRLPVNAEAGHQWDIESVKAAVVKTVETTVEEPEEEEGEPTVVFTFECAADGETQLLIVESDERGGVAGRFRLDVTCEAGDTEEAETEETEE
jgi:predicted secreted protein